MLLTLTVWQRKKSGLPTKAGQGRLDNPTEAIFNAAVEQLLGMVDPEAVPFQIVASLGDSSRGVQLVEGWTDSQIKVELWGGYRSLMSVNG